MANIEVIPNPVPSHKYLIQTLNERRGVDDSFTGLEAPLSVTPLDGRFLTEERTTLEPMIYAGPHFTWHGISTGFESEISHNPQDMADHPLTKARIERIRELLSGRGFYSTLDERKYTVSPSIAKSRARVFELAQDEPHILNAFRTPYRVGHKFWTLVIPRGDEAFTRVEFNLLRGSGLPLTTVEFRPQPPKHDLEKPALFVTDEGEYLLTEDPLDVRSFMIEVTEKRAGEVISKKVYGRIADNINAGLFDLEDPNAFKRSLEYYAEVYQALLESMYEEKGADFPPNPIQLELKDVRFTEY